MRDTYLDYPFEQRTTGELKLIYCNNGTIGCTENHFSENDRPCYVGSYKELLEHWGLKQEYPKKPLLDKISFKYPILKIEWRRT